MTAHSVHAAYAEHIYRIPCKNCRKVYIAEMARNFGLWMKENQKQAKLLEEVPRDSHSQSRINQWSQITSTQRITSSTVMRRISLAVSLTGQHGGSGRSSRSDRKVKTSWIETRDLPAETRLWELTGVCSDISWTVNQGGRQDLTGKSRCHE